MRLTAAVAGAGLAAPLLAACARMQGEQETPPGATTVAPRHQPLASSTAAVQPTPTVTPEPDMLGRVALVRTTDRAEGIRRAVELLEYNPLQDKRLFLKPNFNSADPFPGSTHIDTLAELIRLARQMGAGPVTIGDRSGMGNTRAVMRAKGVETLADELEADLVVFDELGVEDWIGFQPPGTHWRNGYAVAAPLLAADGVVQTCCLKTHRYGGHFTLSLKNSVGTVAKTVPGSAYNYMNELHGSADQRRMIAEINAAYQPDLVVLDGMQAFVDGGPDYGTLVAPQVILAGTDRVAIDAVGVAILRYFGTTAEVRRGSIFQQEQIARAVELGLGVGSPGQIDLLSDDEPSREFVRALQELLLA